MEKLKFKHPDRVMDEAVDHHFFTHSVAIYEIYQAYGGPEEGGWWYYAGDRVDSHEGLWFRSVYQSEEDADEACRTINKVLNDFNERQQYPITSVLSYECSYLEARVYEGWPPDHFPECRPHFE